eukprot:g52116.t1
MSTSNTSRIMVLVDGSNNGDKAFDAALQWKRPDDHLFIVTAVEHVVPVALVRCSSSTLSMERRGEVCGMTEVNISGCSPFTLEMERGEVRTLLLYSIYGEDAPPLLYLWREVRPAPPAQAEAAAGPGFTELMDSNLYTQANKALKERGKTLIEHYAAVCKEKDIKHVTTAVLTAGNAKEAVMKYAKEKHVTLIVVGTRGLSAIKRLLMGSFSHFVVQHAECDVVVVKALPPVSAEQEAAKTRKV